MTVLESKYARDVDDGGIREAVRDVHDLYLLDVVKKVGEKEILKKEKNRLFGIVKLSLPSDWGIRLRSSVLSRCREILKKFYLCTLK